MKAVAAGILVALSLLLHHATARACDCGTAEPEPVAARAALATVVHGRVMAIRSAPAAGGYQVDLFVMRAWKGATAGGVVTLVLDASSCGYFAVPGDDLLIYAPAGKPVQQCAGADTARVRWGAEIDVDAAALGAPQSSAAAPAAVSALPVDVDVDGLVTFAETGARPRLQVRTTKVRKGAVRRQTLDVISSTGACAVALPARGARVKLTAARVHGTLVVSSCAAATGVRALRRASRP